MKNQLNNLMKNLSLFIALAGMLWSFECRAADLERSVVEVQVTYQAADPSMPWQRNPLNRRQGTATVIGPGQALTAEKLVRHHVLVELYRARTGFKTAVRVAATDPQTGLAILTWDELPALSDLQPLAVAETVPPDAELIMLHFDESGQILRDQARLIERALSPLPDAPGQAWLMYQAWTSLNAGQDGTPVLYQNKLAGVVLRTEQKQNTCLILAASVLRRFLQDVQNPPYAGVASAGFAWTPLLDPVKRAFYGADPLWTEANQKRGGIEVTRVLPGSGAQGVLQPGDIILEWDGYALDAQGYYDDPEFGRLLLPQLISGRRRPGDRVNLHILRAGAAQTLQIELRRRVDAAALIPENIALDQPEYLIECGLVFRELDGEYLRAQEDNWPRTASNARLIHLYHTRAQAPQQAGEHIVILSGVLPDTINIGYHAISDAIVTAINGEAIHCLADVLRITDRDEGISRVTLLAHGQDIVLDTSQRAAANQRLAALFRIPTLRHQRTAQP